MNKKIEEDLLVGTKLLTAPQAQRSIEKDVFKSFSVGEKVEYYARRKSTWLTLGAIGYAVATKDYASLASIVVGLF